MAGCLFSSLYSSSVNFPGFNKIVSDIPIFPISWNNPPTFKTLKSFNKRVQYCEQHLTRISSGSSRIVYLVDDDKVLKLAKNQKGIAQNNVEISLGNEGYYTCFADVYDYDNDGLWLEMEFCRKSKKSDFKRIYGIPFEVLCYGIAEMVEYRNKFNPFDKYKPYWKQLMNSENNMVLEFIDSFREYIGGQGLETTGDLYRISSYGVTKDNRIVLVDYGLDDVMEHAEQDGALGKQDE